MERQALVSAHALGFLAVALGGARARPGARRVSRRALVVGRGATGVLVQQKERCRTDHFWVLVAPGRHVLFEFTRNHTNDAVNDVLSGYQGYLVADAHVVYDHLYATGDVVVEVNRATALDPMRLPHGNGGATRLRGAQL